MGRAEDLFSRIEHGGIAAIETLVSGRQSEELFLEFKRSKDDGQGSKLHDHDRVNLKKAIGGFSNSEGGVIVWGIDCSRNPAIGDVASTLLPLANPRRFVSLLEGAVSGCTVPPVTGVRSIAIDIDQDIGLVATYVPKSSHAPHQLAGEGKYVIRAGSDFVPAPHGVVAGLFGHPPHPVVFPNFLLAEARMHDGRAYASLTVILINDGQVVAEDLFVSVLFTKFPEGAQVLAFEPKTDWPTTSAFGADRSIISPREVRLPPGGFQHALTIHLRLDVNPTSDLKWRLTVGCRGAIPYTEDMEVSEQDLWQLVSIVQARGGDMYKIAANLFGLKEDWSKL